MEIKTKLQEPFTYNEKITSIILIIGVLIILITILTYLIIKYKKQIFKFLRKTKNRNIKDYYLKKINTLQDKFNNNRLTRKEASFELSKLLRSFIFDEEDIDLLTKSSEEIEKLNMPEVSDIIKNLYNPEFSRLSDKEINVYFDNTKKVISKWK